MDLNFICPYFQIIDNNIFVSITKNNKTFFTSIDIYSGEKLELFSIEGVLYSSFMDNDILYGLISDKLSCTLSIIKIDIKNCNLINIFSTANMEDLKITSSTFILTPIQVVGDKILFSIKNFYEDTIFYIIDKHSGKVFWKKKTNISNVAISKKDYSVFFVSTEMNLISKDILTGQEKKLGGIKTNNADCFGFKIEYKDDSIFINTEDILSSYIYNLQIKKLLPIIDFKNNKNFGYYKNKKYSYVHLYDDEHLIYWDKKYNAIKIYNFIYCTENIILSFVKTVDVFSIDLHTNAVVITASPNLKTTYANLLNDINYFIIEFNKEDI